MENTDITVIEADAMPLAVVEASNEAMSKKQTKPTGLEHLGIKRSLKLDEILAGPRAPKGTVLSEKDRKQIGQKIDQDTPPCP
jgi:hypothetical protein